MLFFVLKKVVLDIPRTAVWYPRNLLALVANRLVYAVAELKE